MNRTNRHRLSAGRGRSHRRSSRLGAAGLLAAGVLSLGGLLALCAVAQNAPPSAAPAPAAGRVRPNYGLAARFMPKRVDKLVFDVAVTPHWFELSDRFWYSYKTPAGTRYWIVDPLRRAKSPLWDNAKVAASLSRLLNLPYDAQHLPVKNLKLVEKDTAIQFEVEVSKSDVIPGETPKAAGSGEQQTNRQGAGNQGQGGRAARGGPAAKVRTLYFEYELSTGKITRLDQAPLKTPSWAAVSPDGRTVVFAREYNLYMMDAENYLKAQRNPADPGIVETQLSTDGVARYSYARHLTPEDETKLKKEDKGDAGNKAGMRRPPVAIYWSKDSKKFAFIRRDNRKVGQLWVIHNLANPRPILETYTYPMPGEDNVPIDEIQIYDVASKQRLMVQPKKFVDETLQIASAPLTSKEREDLARRRRVGEFAPPLTGRWVSGTSDKLYFTSRSRDFKHIDVLVADTATGAVKTLFEESSNVWIDSSAEPYAPGASLHLVNHGKEILWWSERDGWGHYYLYKADGSLENQVDSGEFVADQILAVDDATREMYFTAWGREPGEDPYYTHLYRIGLDGAGLKLLTPGKFTNALVASDDGKYFVDTYSRVDTAPVSVLYDRTGASPMKLETADLSRLLAAGYQLPETFHVKAADGITDLYGVMYKPFDFHPSRKYPLIEYVYPGPQTESVAKAFAAKAPADSANVALAQLGFIVIEVGARGGSPQRDKWYDSYGYGDMRDYGLADKVVAAEELAEEYPFIDLHRVGIWGHSGGGFMTAAAMLEYPHFFKAGWSESGNHENNIYNNTWSEKYHGVREVAEKDGTAKFLYNIDKNSEIAKNLEGHLMLTTGDMDNNVNLANTMRLANALIKADKRFEMLVFPGMRHPYTPIADYVLIRRMDFFARWLLGAAEDSADILELQNERQATPSTGHALGEGVGGPGNP